MTLKEWIFSDEAYKLITPIVLEDEGKQHNTITMCLRLEPCYLPLWKREIKSIKRDDFETIIRLEAS